MADEPVPPTYAELSEKEKASGEISVSEVNLNESKPDPNTQYPPPPQASPYPAGPPGSQPYPPHGNQSYPPTGNPPYPVGGPYQPPPQGGPYQPPPEGGPYQPPTQGGPYQPPAQGGPYQPPPLGGPYQPPPQGGPYPPPPQGAPYPPPVQGTPYPAPPQGAPYPTPNTGVPPPSYNLATGNQPDSTATAGGYPTNPNAPAECELGKPEDYPDMIMRLADGQRTTIEQLEQKRGRHWGDWICWGSVTILAHVGFFSCIAVLVWQVPLKKQYEAWEETASYDDIYKHKSGPPYNRTSLICASVFLVICYIVGVIEGWMSDTQSYVDNINKLADFRQEHKTNRSKVPIVIWEAKAYHYSKERTVWKDGVMVSRRRSSDIHKCVSFEKRIAFPFSRCVDASGDLDGFKKGQINRFEFEKTFGFLDEHTQEQYKVQKQAILHEAKYKDEDYEFEETLVLPEMKEKTTVFMDEGCRTSLMSSKFYCFLIFTMLTWPYRLFFRCATRKRRYSFVKLIAL